MLRQTPAAFRKSPVVTGSRGGGAVGSPTKHKRVDSEQFIEPEENMNVSWLDGRGTWLAYVLVLAGIRLGELSGELPSVPLIPSLCSLSLLLLVLGFLPLGNYAQWTLLHTLHCAVHYLAFHYNTGVPWTETRLMQGKYDPLTFWEALDIRYDHHKVRPPLCLFPPLLFCSRFSRSAFSSLCPFSSF